MGNTDTKAGAAAPKGMAKARVRRPSVTERILGKSPKSGQPKSVRAPTDDEVSLAKLLSEASVAPAGPPFYAVSSSWLAAWSAFALAGADEPGPISNAALVGSMPVPGEEAVWLSAEHWHLLHGLNTGGPVLCRASQRLSLSNAPHSDCSPSSPSASSSAPFSSPEPKLVAPNSPTGGLDPGPSIELVQRASLAHAQRCQQLEHGLADAVDVLERGSWAKKRSSLGSFKKTSSDNPRTAARQRFKQAVATNCGGEELREALQALREAGDIDALATLEPCVAEICVHEEAQIVLACLLQALQDSDRVSLELWLEQADVMGLEALIAGIPQLLGPLNRHLLELQEHEKGALKQHAHAAELHKEGPSERMWRLSMAAFEEKDEVMLNDLHEESRSIGLDVSAVELLLEELREQRAANERASRKYDKPSWSYRAGEGPKEPKDDDRKGRSGAWNDPSSWATPGSGDWRDPSSWRSTEEFLDAWRKWKHQDRVRQYGAEAAERMRQEEERERDNWRQTEEESKRKAYFERERTQRQQEEQRRREQSYGGASFGSGTYGRYDRYGSYSGYAGSSSAGFGQSYGGYGSYPGYNSYSSSSGFGNSSGGYQRHAPPPARSSGQDTGQALRALGLPPGRIPPLSELKSAYKKAAMRAHPDRPHNRGRQTEATAEFQNVKSAFDQLSEAAPRG